MNQMSYLDQLKAEVNADFEVIKQEIDVRLKI
jgi:hypothetical protein